jgi:hypothetical protein
MVLGLTSHFPYSLRSHLDVFLALGARILGEVKKMCCTVKERDRDVLEREKGVLGSENDIYLLINFESYNVI